MEAILFKLSLIANVLALISSWLYLFWRVRSTNRLWQLTLGLGLVLHLASFVVRTKGFWSLYEENQYYLPINTFFGAMSYLALITNMLCFVVSAFYGIGVLGAFVLPLSLMAQSSAAIWADPGMSGLVPALQSYWINIHPLILMGSYGALANAFGVSCAYLIEQRELKSRKPRELTWQMPSLEILDELSYRVIFLALPVLTVGIVMGGIWAWGAWGRFWGWDAKETWSLITWMIYVVYLHLRLARKWSGRRAVWVNFCGFASVLFTFFGVNFLSQLHGYLSG